MTPSPLPNDPVPPMPIQPGADYVPSAPGYLGSGNTGNPVLDEISTAHANLSPQAQQAIEGVHGMLGISPAHSDPALAASAAPSPEVAVPGVSGPRAPLPSLSAETPAPTNPMLPGMVGVRASDIGSPSVGAPPVSELGPNMPSPSGNPSAPPMPINPPMTAAQSELQRRETTGSGVHQFAQNHKWLGVPVEIADAIGSGLFPRFAQFIPGSSAKHDLQDVPQAEQEVADEAAQAKSAADVARTEGETGEIPARTDLEKAQTTEANARAQAITNPTKALTPKDKYIPVGDGVFNAESGDWAKEPTDKKLSEVTEIDPEKGEALGIIKNKDGKYVIPNAALGELLKPPPEKTTSPEQQFLDEYHAKNPGSSVADAEKAFRQLTPKETPDRGQNFIDPATHKMVRVEPGGAVPEGAVTASGISGENVSTNKQDEAAKKALADNQKEYETMQRLAKADTGPSDLALLMHYIGATRPDSLGRLRLNQNEVNLVLGARSAFGDLEALEQKLTTGAKLTPPQRQQMLETMKILSGQPAEGASPQRPKGVPGNAQFDPTTRRWRVP